ncbi:ribonuclease D [Trueperella pecoris]|uniref:Ribonuclease D n=1 Tax=Trueperella pecoris TaxID=2733571 RepID=A0A7M1R339_9ACTO|nr:HRDC domain-containing protein [Trueperella pecoris]QOR48541.1 ribonuclease D [Trueperella pecoris]
MSSSTPARPLDVPRDGLPSVTNEDIDDAVARLASGRGSMAVDTERAMGLRYSNRAYLVQIRRAGAGTFLIDPVGIEDQLEDLRGVMSCEWILHAADQDLPCLHELGLYPTKVFDTEIAALLLGYERVSLQALCQEVLGWTLAKEHSNADWSQRPLPPPLLAYAALDVELLHELAEKLTDQLIEAGRLEWFEQECEEVRLRKPAPPAKQPWRRTSRQAGIRDRRALAMLRELWRARDGVAKRRDLAPGKVLPNQVLAELAARKPRSRSDVVNSPLFRSRQRKRDLDTWWNAIDIAWRLDERALPERKYTEDKDPYPPIKRWDRHDEAAAARWEVMRPKVLALAEELGIRQDLLLKPAIQKMVAWTGWATQEELVSLLAEHGARPWQIKQVAGPVHVALQAAKVL